ncbi:hypothetical protein KKF29_03400, partial [Patescibacteria group bacterium]|nr:hypothetical protein [Patescibacteria group bacterium]
TKEEKDQYEQIIEDINQKMAEVDNMLLMNNEDGARKLLVESKEKLDQVPKDSKIYEEKGVETANNIQIGLDKVFNVNRITDPETSIDYSQISSDVGVSNIERIGDTIYAYDNNSDSVYSGKLEDGSTQVVVDNQGGPTLIAVAKDSAATTLGWSDENTLVQFNPVLEKLSEVGIGETADSINISDLKVFGSRLYALSKDGQIYKFTADGDNYGDSAPWLTEDNILSNSKSLAIDGAVYVVDGNGEIKKFFSGVVDDEFSLDAVEPVLTNPSLIYTDENITSIYLLDPENKRALRFNKEGELTSQYISDKFDNLTDLVVDEDTGKLYLLNGSQVYMVKI